MIRVENGADARPLQLPLLALQLLAIDLIRDDLRQHAQEANVSIVEGRLGSAAETAERAVQGSVPEPDGSTDVRTDAGLARQREIGRACIRGRVVNEMRQLALGHAHAVGLLDGQVRADLEVEPVVLAVDRLHDEVPVE